MTKNKSGFHDLNISNAILIISDFTMLSLVFIFIFENNALTENSKSNEFLSMISQFILFSLSTQLAILAVGLYNEKIRENFNGIIVRLCVALFLSYLITLSLSFFFAKPFLSGHSHILLYASVLSALIISRYIVINCKYENLGKRRVLLLGYGKRAQLIHSTMRRKTDRVNFEIVGYVEFEGDETVRDGDIKPVELRGTLEEYIIDNDIDEVVVALDERRNNLPNKSLFYCKLHDIQITDVIDFVERETGQVAINHIYPSFVIYNKENSDHYITDFFNWLFNSLIGLIILALVWPFIVIAIIGIKVEDGLKAPIFYTQKRVGIKGRIFTIFKFRSMITDAEVNGAQMSKKSDNRVTRVGKVIRKYRIDELPQLFNIFAGNMSFVGPRPERPQFSDEFESAIPFYAHRHSVKPGLTGWAQLKYPYGDGLNDAQEKLKFDLYYIKHRSFILDILILIKTSEIVIFGKGR